MRKVNLIPMAGRGQRFLDVGHKTPKPLIDIDGLPMIIRAANCLPDADKWIFICRKEHIDSAKIDIVLNDHFSNSKIISIDYLTEGQASTCLLAKDLLKKDDILTIGACDNGMLYDKKKFEKLISINDAIIWTFKNNKAVLKDPHMYGWVDVDSSGNAIKVSCKKPISNNPINDHAIIGAFTFKKAEHFIINAENMINKGLKVNNEYYLDNVLFECIKNGVRVAPFKVDQYNCWGTPSDLLEYFQKQ